MNVAIPKAGDELGGYTLLRPLGRGGAGIVWEVEDINGARFALKLLHPAIAADPTARVRLGREAAVLNRIRSAGVASLVDLETEATQPFVVTELVDGLDLREELRQRGPLSFADAREVARSLKDTLQVVHEAGVIHRDLKPSNIILGKVQPVLIDFGIAQADEDDRLTSTGLVSGTPGWVAPEVMRGTDPDEGSDWWAWAAVFLNMITARGPYGSGTNDAILSRQLVNQFDLQGVYPQLADLLRDALGEPHGRPSPSEVLQRLDQLDPELVDSWANTSLQTDPSTHVLPLQPPGEDLGQDRTEYVDPLPTDAPTVALSSQVSPGYNQLDGYEYEGVPNTRLMPQSGQEVVLPETTFDMPAQYAGQPLGGNEGFYPQPQYGYPIQTYSYAPPQSAFWFSICVVALLAALPVAFGQRGVIATVLTLLGVETIGYARAWREKRRIGAGGVRDNDNMLASLAGCVLWPRAAVSLAFNLAFAVLIAVAAWALYSVNAGGAALENEYLHMISGSHVPSDQIVALALWLSNAFAILLVCVGVGGAYLREGAYSSAGLIGRPGRIVVGALAVVASFAFISF